MRLRAADTVLLATTTISSYVVRLGSDLTPCLYRAQFPHAPDSVRRALMPAATRFACDFGIAFVVLICVLGLAAWVLVRRKPGRSREWLMIGIVSQCLVVWAAAWCLGFEAFRSGGCLHHEPEFDVARFLLCFHGIFPITLAALLLPLIHAVQELACVRGQKENTGD